MCYLSTTNIPLKSLKPLKSIKSLKSFKTGELGYWKKCLIFIIFKKKLNYIILFVIIKFDYIQKCFFFISVNYL